MTSTISITPGKTGELGAINSQLCTFLSENTVGTYDIKLNGQLEDVSFRQDTETALADRTRREHAPTAPIDILAIQYPDVEVRKLLSISAVDTSFTDSAQLALYLSKINDRPIELLLNQVPVVVEPGQIIDDVRRNFLENFALQPIEVDRAPVICVDTLQQQSDGPFSLEDCVRNAMIVAQLLEQTVRFTFYSPMPSETMKGFVAPTDDFMSVMEACEPTVRSA